MNTAIIVGALGVAVLLAVGLVLSRQSSRQKKQAVASLEAERAALGSHTILDLVDEEVEDLGLRSIPGAEGRGPDVLLRAWRDAPESIRASDPDHLEFIDADAGDEGVILRTKADIDEPPSEDEQGAEDDG